MRSATNAFFNLLPSGHGHLQVQCSSSGATGTQELERLIWQRMFFTAH